MKKEEIAGARRNIVVVSADIEPTGKREALALTWIHCSAFYVVVCTSSTWAYSTQDLHLDTIAYPPKKR